MKFNAKSVKGWLDQNERSASWLARKADIAHATMVRVMSGQQTPSLETIGALAAVTGLKSCDLIIDASPSQSPDAPAGEVA